MSGEDQQCLKDLRLAGPSDGKARIELTKCGLLEDPYRRILDHADFRWWCDDEHSQLLWIKGDPGKGKMMLLIGIIIELSKHPKQSIRDAKPTSFLLCRATDSRLNNATVVLRGLIYLLVVQQKSLDQRRSLISHVRKKYNDAGRQLFEDANAFFASSHIFQRYARRSKFDRSLFDCRRA
jgi:hypothetical protein